MTQGHLTLSQRVKVASATHSGMELEPQEIKYLDATFDELRRRAIEDQDDAVFVYKQKIVKAERRLHFYAIAAAGAATIALNGFIHWYY